jgi:regulator of sigma E protease
MEIVMIVVFGLLGLNIIILVHELGHFIAAKLCGVGVETFSLGWGKKLVGFTFKGTNYQLAMFPIGGYCKLKGELFKPDFTEEDFQKAKTEKGGFLGEKLWKKLAIVLFGPFASFIFAAIVFAIIVFVRYDIPTAENKIVLSGDVAAFSGNGKLPAETAGLESGDRILSINGTETKTFYDISETIKKTKKGESLSLSIMRADATIKKTLSPIYDQLQDKFIIGITQWIDPVIAKVNEGKAADKAGLQAGDRILFAYETPDQSVVSDITSVGLLTIYTRNHFDYLRMFNRHPASVTMYVSRQNERIPLVVNPAYTREGNPDIGIEFKTITLRSPAYNPIESLGMGAVQTWDLLTGIVKGFGKIFLIKVNSIDDVVAGPVRLTKMVGEEAVSGFSQGIGAGFIQYFRFICILSVFISFMNLLPVPALDGGQAVLSIIMFARKNLSLKFVYRYQLVGFFFMAALILLAVSSDAFYFL